MANYVSEIDYTAQIKECSSVSELKVLREKIQDRVDNLRGTWPGIFFEEAVFYKEHVDSLIERNEFITQQPAAPPN